MTPTQFTARTLKAFKNKANSRYFSEPQFYGLDGEMVLPDVPWNTPRQCSLITGLLGRHNDTTIADWVCFDYVTPRTMDLPYRKRYPLLRKMVAGLDPHIQLMPFEIVRSMEDVWRLDEKALDDNLEGSVLRNPDAPVKSGRSTLAGEYWRIKQFIDFEFRIEGFEEAEQNNNEAKTNALGRTERSSHKANKVGKGMVGNVKGTMLKDVVWRGKVLFPKGHPVKVGPGQLTHAEREYYFRNPNKLVGQIGKGKTFPQGVKSKPRMPIFLSLRSKEDML